MGKTLFFGGTFNPPHIAHRKMLEAVAALPEIECVLVAPTNIPPHKEVPGLFATKKQRLDMCELLCNGINKARVSDIEFRREGKSYSYFTLSELKEQYGNISMLIGGDMVTSFTTWFNYKELLKTAEFYAVRRKGTHNVEFYECIEALRKEGGTFHVLEFDFPKVSSTEVREAVLNGEGVEELISKSIYDYIISNGLYRKA